MRSTRHNIIVSLLFTFCGGPALVLVVFPYTITRFRIPAHQPAWRLAAAWLLIAAGLVPLLESIARFIIVGRGTLVPTAPTKHLVVSGLYRYVRNPMYLGVLTAVLGEALLFASRTMIEYLAVVFVLFHLFVCFYEEPKLTRTHPEEYPHYRRHVRRWLPRLHPWYASHKTQI
jgi:protein-S-isoprenylcysteine O-methyltransferase Ste14